MKPNFHLHNFTSLLLFLLFFIFPHLSCRKEQPLSPEVQTSPTLQNYPLARSPLPSPVLQVNGGGQGSFGADLDGDGDTDGSHFGVGASIFGDGSAQGHFECLMAGNADILRLPLMAVEGNLTKGSAEAEGSVTVKGVATVNLGKGTRFTDVPFSVTLHAGGPQAGSLKLTVFGAFDGVPGDTDVGNGNYDLPTETVAKGQIKFHHD